VHKYRRAFSPFACLPLATRMALICGDVNLRCHRFWLHFISLAELGLFLPQPPNRPLPGLRGLFSLFSFQAALGLTLPVRPFPFCDTVVLSCLICRFSLFLSARLSSFPFFSVRFRPLIMFLSCSSDRLSVYVRSGSCAPSPLSLFLVLHCLCL